MKRSTQNAPRYLICIDVILNHYSDDVAAARTVDYLTRRSSIQQEYQITVEQRAAYNDLIYNVMQIILHHGLQILHEYQSGDSYSYYIAVKPEYYEGLEDILGQPVEVKFRVSDHPMKLTDLQPDSPIIYTVLINKEDCRNVRHLLKKVRDICNDLRVGDYSSVLDRNK